ncbi:MAG: D-hexose-6-phosphate mutarotase [Chthoniobacterales bacterium]|nr:D-hexose-6-phosphate mutarotase [Chthoniobacterales bacterium]
MSDSSFLDHWKKFEIPGTVIFSQDDDGFNKINVTTASSAAEIYLQGAHVTSFQKKGEDPMLFMSSSGRIARGKMLHGGIPLCFPWFGNRQGETLSHGIARLHPWDLKLCGVTAQGSVILEFQLPQKFMKDAGWMPVNVNYRVIVGEKLSLQFNVTNPPTSKDSFFYEECFHSYFLVENIDKITIHGLKDLHYLDKTENLVSKLELSDAIPITQETNRIYLNSTEPIEIHDSLKKRTIRIEKYSSHSTIVWNPWMKNAKLIPDFDPEDYKKMLCVESGNVGAYSRELSPGATACLSLDLSTRRDAQG